MKIPSKFIKYLFLLTCSLGIANRILSPDIKSYTGYTFSELNEMRAKKEAEENKQLIINELKRSVSDFYIPVTEGQVSTIFRDYFRGDHKGVDIGRIVDPKLRKVKRPDILAVETGIVDFVGPRESYGKMIEIEHTNDFKTRYGHLKEIFVEKGDTVFAQQIIGVMGNTGNSRSSHKGSGIHVHFEILKNGEQVNPAKYFKQYKGLERDQIVYSAMNYLPVVEIVGTHSKTELEDLVREKPEGISSLLEEDQTKDKQKTGNFLTSSSFPEESQTKETYYTIQIAASVNPLTKKEIKKFEEIYDCEINCTLQKDKALVCKDENEEMYYKYSIGNFKILKQAFDFKNSLEKNSNQNLGVLVYKDNKIVETRWNF